MSEASAAPKSFRLQKSSPAAIGFLLAIAAAILPLFSPMFFFFFSLPFLLAAFVLAIVSLVRGGVAGGIILLIAVFFAFPISLVALVSRNEIVKTSHAVRERIKKHEPLEGVAEEPTPAPSPEPAESTAATLPMIIRLRQSVSIQLPAGNTVLPPGTRIQFISRNGETVRVRYSDADYEIPISATDLK